MAASIAFILVICGSICGVCDYEVDDALDRMVTSVLLLNVALKLGRSFY